MTDINTGYTQAPVGARLPRFLANQGAPVGGNNPTYGQDQLNVSGPAGGAAADVAAIQQQLQSANPADRFRAVVSITNMPPAEAIPLLQMAAQNDNAQVRDLATQALGVMQRMPGATQPVPGQTPPANQQAPFQQPVQPGVTQPQGQPWNTAPQQQYTGYQPTQVQPMQYTPANMGQMSPDDAAFMVQTLQTDLSAGSEKGTLAIQQLMGLVQANPAVKENVFNLLLNHIYHSYDPSVTEAIKALGAMGDPRALPYIEAIHRTSGYRDETYAAALQVIKQMRMSQGGQPGTASVGGATPEYVRIQELELKKGGQKGMLAFNEIRNALGPDPRAQSPIRAEVIRVLLTHIASSNDGMTVSASCQLLGQMGAREMDTLRYLDAVKRSSSAHPDSIRAATAAIQQIMSTPAVR
jgi:hypothetical protein